MQIDASDPSAVADEPAADSGRSVAVSSQSALDPRGRSGSVSAKLDFSEFDSVEFEDAQGRPLHASVYLGKTSYPTSSIAVVGGRSEPFSVTEDAATIVVKKQGVELRRMPLELVRGQLNTIRP